MFLFYYQQMLLLQTYTSKIEKVPRDIRRAKSSKITTSSEKGLVSRSRTYASPKGTGPGVRRSKRPLSACHTRRKQYEEFIGLILIFILYFEYDSIVDPLPIANGSDVHGWTNTNEFVVMFLDSHHTVFTFRKGVLRTYSIPTSPRGEGK